MMLSDTSAGGGPPSAPVGDDGIGSSGGWNEEAESERVQNQQ